MEGEECARQASNNRGNPGAFARNLPGDAQSDARRAESAPAKAPDDPDLTAVATAWPMLPSAIKAGILALVKASGGPE
jgi:hypothetical protein